MNEELVTSAVSFLQDPNVTSSPLTKKVEFLESKGLSQQEIEEALKRANGEVTTTSPSSPPTQQHQQQQPSYGHQQPPIDYYNVTPPQVPDRSWKDYFIMATATAGVTYGLYQVVSKYLVPSIIPAKQSSIDQDKAKIDEEFIKIDKVLEQLELDQNEIKVSNEEKSKEIDVVIDNVNDFLSKYNKDKLKFDDDLKLMKLEIDNLKNSVEKNMNLTKDNIKDELEEIQEELTSLKNLIKARSEQQSKDHDGSSSSFRKVPPVSSIPSALEILKRAKANANGSSGPSSKSGSVTPPQASNGKSTVPGNGNEKPEQQVPPAGTTTVDNVTAAGIPAWQLKHKEQEEQRENQKRRANKEEEEDEDQHQRTGSGIPGWQQANAQQFAQAHQSYQSPQHTQASEDEKVAKSIANVGVPSWQLNAATNNS